MKVYVSNDFSKFGKDIFNLLYQARNFYPGFNSWIVKFRNEESLGLRKTILLIKEDSEEVVGISLVRYNPSPKICSFVINENYRDQGLGRILLETSLSNLRTSTPLITVPGGVKETAGMCKFLSYNGFNLSGISFLGEDKHELIFNGTPDNTSIVLSIKNFWGNEIISGRKLVEFRKKSIPKNVKVVFINNTRIMEPVISGYFIVDEIIENSPEELWNEFGSVGSIKKEDYDDYFSNSFIGYAIKVKTAYSLGIPSRIMFGNEFKSPQFFKYL